MMKESGERKESKGAIGLFVNSSLRLECVRVLQEGLLVPVLMYGN